MSQSIAIADKGGCGKTMVAALIVKLLVEADRGPVLAVDADPNLNLNAALGVEVSTTVGDVREKELVKGEALPAGMTRPQFVEFRMQQALVEGEGFDLLVMGRPEGPGCYCFANELLRAALDRLSQNYRYLVMDCEAGLEHLSRRTTRDVDLLITISDPSLRGLETAARICELAGDLRTQVGRFLTVVNRLTDGLSPELEAVAAHRGLTIAATIPENEEVRRLDAQGKPLVSLADDNPVLLAVKEFLTKVGLL